MRSVPFALAFPFLVASLSGCSKGSTEPPGSCYRDSDNACTEYGSDKSAAGKRLCTGHRWTTGTNSCPIQGRVGRCSREGGKWVDHMYSGPPNQFTPEAAKAACETGGGTFASGG